MAAIHGKNTRVYYGAVDVSPYMNTAAISAATETAQSTGFGQDAHTYVPGQKSRIHTAEGHYDKDVNVVRASLGVEDGVLTHCPGGASAIGDLAWMSAVIGTEYDESSPIADVVAFSWEAPVSGHTALGYVLHPLAEDTNSTTGATRDDTTATSTGWVAHIHVPTAPDGGSWVIKLVDGAAANMSDAADVSGGAFTAITTATSQRLVSATTTATVKRYVRYVATRTGGAPGDGITFVLSFSRSYNP
jgi:hypothetical protein